MTTTMIIRRCACACSIYTCIVFIGLIGNDVYCTDGTPRRILLDTDVDTDDLFALLYILKLNRSEFDLQAITINTNSWSNSGHAVNQVYDILYMMGRDDIAIGVGGEGGILQDGTILPNVGGYLPIIEQGNGTDGYCRYRQAIPVGSGGRLDGDTNFGFRKSFLPQGKRRYIPVVQPTSQQVMIDKISAGRITIFVLGSNTNLAIFLMSNPHLKNNIDHIYIMGGSIRSRNPNSNRGNLFTDYTSNPYAEFNMFVDPFAAYQMISSGIPVTLVPLDSTNTIPVSRYFFEEFEKNQHTYEAKYSFMSLKMTHDTWFDDQFFESYYMWGSFLAGVATSIMLKQNKSDGENEFAEMKYINITVITSNEPYRISDGSNPFFDGREKPKFNLTRGSVHSGHIQTGLRDPFCVVANGKGRCEDGYTEEVTGRAGVRVLAAGRAKRNPDKNSNLSREYFKAFLDVLNQNEQSGLFNFTMQFPYYKEVLYKPDFKGRKLGNTVVYDMDMSAGDFLALFYLLKLPVEEINLKAILVAPTGWANAATIDVVYDLLHMMGRDDIPIGLGDVFALNQADLVNSAVGDCKYSKAIPHGSGGFLDSDTLYGLAHDLPRSPRRYTAENDVNHGAPRNTDHPELRQPQALETWQSVIKSLKPGSKVTILTNGPLTNVAKIILSDKNSSSPIKDIFIVGGHIVKRTTDRGNAINIPSNEYAELNMFLDPLAAKTVFSSSFNITLIPLNMQRRVNHFTKILHSLYLTKKTPEALFARRLLSRLHKLKKTHPRYQHMDTFLGEILGAVILAGDDSVLKTTYIKKHVDVSATGVEYEDGKIIVDQNDEGSVVKVLENVDPVAYYKAFANQLGEEKQSAVIGSFEEQKRIWSSPPK